MFALSIINEINLSTCMNVVIFNYLFLVLFGGLIKSSGIFGTFLIFSIPP